MRWNIHRTNNVGKLTLHQDVFDLTFQTRKNASADDSIILDEELNKDVPDDAKIIEGLRDTRGARQTIENATSVFVKWPALNQQKICKYD